MSRFRSLVVATVAASLTAAVVAFPVPAQARSVSVAADQVRAGEWWLTKLNIEKAWPLSNRGAGVTVGVLDSGIDVTHPDLAGAVVGGKDFSGKGAANGERPTPDSNTGQPNYHGTEMAGYIAGRGHGSGNSQGLIGVAPAARLLSASTAFPGTDDTAVGAGLKWLVDNGAKVVNMSFGGVEVPLADIAYAQAHDVVLIGAAGNDSLPPAQPSNVMGNVAVAGVMKNLATWPDSSRGGPVIAGGTSLPPSDSAAGIAVAAPAADEVAGGSTNQDVGGMVGLSRTGTGYTRLLGTSNSAAIVSGIAALIRAAYPKLNAANVINRLGQTARHVNPAGGAGYSVTQGFGVVDAYAAVKADVPNACENPFGSVASPQSFGLWKSISNYKPKCTGSTTSPSASTPATAASSSAAALPTSSDSSSGVPVWVWPLVAIVVVAVIGGVIYSRRSRGPAVER